MQLGPVRMLVEAFCVGKISQKGMMNYQKIWLAGPCKGGGTKNIVPSSFFIV